MTSASTALDVVAQVSRRAKPLPRGAVRRHEPQLREVRLVADVDDELDTSALEREFPTIRLERVETRDPQDVVFDDFAWRGAFDFQPFDERMEEVCALGRVAVRGSDAAGVALELLARYQRLVLRRNRASSTALFDAVLDVHAVLLDEAGVERDHALDTWQWLLRLDPDAELAPQIAALFHVTEFVDRGAHERLEHRPSRIRDQDTSVAAGERVHAILRSVGLELHVAERVQTLLSGRASGEPEARLLDDADGLSFLSLLSAPYADHFGLAQTRRKSTHTLSRLSANGLAMVALVRLRPDVGRLLDRA